MKSFHQLKEEQERSKDTASGTYSVRTGQREGWSSLKCACMRFQEYLFLRQPRLYKCALWRVACGKNTPILRTCTQEGLCQ